MKAKPFNLILLGETASGKATQSARLGRRYRLYDFDMGETMRRMRGDPRFERRYRLSRVLAVGKIVATAVARQILKDTIRRVPAPRGILFDGHPKMLGEAKLAARELERAGRADPLVIYLHIPVKEALKRKLLRGRADDTPASLKERARYYRVHVRAAVKFYRKRYRFARVSGLGTRDAVFARLVAVIERWRNARQSS